MFEIIAAIITVTGGWIGGYYTNKKRNTENSFSGTLNRGNFVVYSDKEAPDELWSNFVKNYKSFNDSWVMELNHPEEYLDVHKKRYNDPKCGQFNFLFFIGEDESAFLRFVRFQAMIHLNFDPEDFEEENFLNRLSTSIEKPLPNTLDNITVYLSNKSRPKQTFFRGYKYDEKKDEYEKISIWYLTLGSNEEEPHVILGSKDERFWKDLDRTWNNESRKSEKIHGKKIFKKYLELCNSKTN